MPIYNYKCPECNEEGDIIRKFSEIDDPVECDCGANRIRVIKAPGLVWSPTTGRKYS